MSPRRIVPYEPPNLLHPLHLFVTQRTSSQGIQRGVELLWSTSTEDEGIAELCVERRVVGDPSERESKRVDRERVEMLDSCKDPGLGGTKRDATEVRTQNN